ncbi:uncharacterized protein [Dermacentor albipictus]|uniref:uncharacterized protein isoform X1 n=1 Tax=Dermacentor albipictus TaxID=60249 RepID=UPI0038FD1530
MSTSSPGQARSAWSASLPPNELPIELFFRSGVSTIPVALVPTNGGSIRITNPQAVQKALKATSNHFQTITDVRAFGRGGIVCRSPEQTCVEDLLKCTSFASTPSSSGLPAEELDRCPAHGSSWQACKMYWGSADSTTRRHSVRMLTNRMCRLDRNNAALRDGHAPHFG